jgi:hypothetical protein
MTSSLPVLIARLGAGPFHAAKILAQGDVRTPIPETKYEIAAKPLPSVGLRLKRAQTTKFSATGGTACYLDNQ